MARPTRKNRVKKINILFCCEGKTEENYCKNVLCPYLRKKNLQFTFTVKDFHTVAKAESYQKRAPEEIDYIAFIFDLDECDNRDKIFGFQQRDQEVYSAGKKWAIYYCYPSIEFWYLLHFTSFSRPLANQKSAEKELLKYWDEYEKPMPRDRREAEVLLPRVECAVSNESGLVGSSILSFSNKVTNGRTKLTNPMSSIGEMIKHLEILGDR